MLQSTKLKPVVLGVGPNGIMRVDPKTKEVLDSWDYQVLRNWAYSRKTFVLVRCVLENHNCIDSCHYVHVHNVCVHVQVSQVALGS